MHPTAPAHGWHSLLSSTSVQNVLCNQRQCAQKTQGIEQQSCRRHHTEPPVPHYCLKLPTAPNTPPIRYCWTLYQLLYLVILLQVLGVCLNEELCWHILHATGQRNLLFCHGCSDDVSTDVCERGKTEVMLAQNNSHFFWCFLVSTTCPGWSCCSCSTALYMCDVIVANCIAMLLRAHDQYQWRQENRQAW